MTSAFRRSITWVLCLAAMAAGSLAWTAGVFLYTWADPAATIRVTQAVLADPDASQEVLAPVRDQVIGLIPPELGVPPEQVDLALEAVLDDPAARARIADAFVSPDGALRVSAASEAFEAELARQQPALAPLLESATPQLAMPDLATATSARTAADTWVWRLAVLSAVLFVVSFVLGDPRRTARRFGYWAIGTGILWVIGPFVAAWLAPRVSSSLDATATVVVEEYTRPIGPWALGLVIAGLVALSGSFLVPSMRDVRDERFESDRRRAPGPERRTAAAAPAAAAAAAPARSAPPPAASPAPPTRPVPVATSNGPPTQTMPIRPTWASGEPTPRPDPDNGEVDVWAAYESSAPDSSRPD
jgi:hypothetical protein